jgi:hypothetical protein
MLESPHFSSLTIEGRILLKKESEGFEDCACDFITT